MEKDKQLGIIILAAGKASRMGKPKALLTYKDQSFLLHTFQLAQSIKPQCIVTVLGHYFDQMYEYCNQHDIPNVLNSEYEKGMSTSIKCGLQQLLSQYPFLNVVLILLADQPKIDKSHLFKMIYNLDNEPVNMVCTSYSGTYGVPAIFKKVNFKELLSLEGEKGAKNLIQKQVSSEQNIVSNEEGNIDIDTPEDYNQLIQKGKSSI